MKPFVLVTVAMLNSTPVNMQSTPDLTGSLRNIRIVMVNTTLPANIGAAARAMKTMGLSRLVLVAPKSFPHADATALAAGAADVLEQAEVVATLEEAIADCQLVFGTSARSRTIPWPILDARPACGLAIQEAQQNAQIAIIFGREDRGLTNEELALANYHLTIPVNQEYGVLNVAAAIQVICYELRMSLLYQSPVMTQDQAQDQPSAIPARESMPVIDGVDMPWDEPLVTQAQMQQFFPHLEQMLADIHFMDPANPRLLPTRLRRLFGRIRLDRMEYNLLRGVFGRVQAMSRGTWPPASMSQGSEPAVSSSQQAGDASDV